MTTPAVNAIMVEDLLKPVLLKDLRIQCRARGLNPGGNREVLAERLKEHMLQTGDLTLVAEGSCLPVTAAAPVATGPREPLTENVPGHVQNNYVRPEGQNVGNFITDRPSSRVLAPPGGGSSITLG